MGRLRHLELENFKSYEGKQVVGPFDDFTCVIGPNGSGKSNMMDAVSFVLGVQSRNLRATQLKDLIFRKDSDSAPARKASVKLVYEVSEQEVKGKKSGDELHFMRSITSSGVSTYRLDNKDVTFEVYESTLKEIGVLVKARNFLVFQGDVESVASKSPTELTKLIEQISGSDAFRAEYDELVGIKDESDSTGTFLMQKKKMYVTQKKEVKEQKDEAELFQTKQDQLQDLKSEHVLLQIWKIKEGMEEHQAAASTFKADLAGIKQREMSLENAIQDGKKELARVSKALAAAETDSAKKAKQVGEVMPKLEETRARLKSLRKRLAELEKGIGAVDKDREQQESDVADMRSHITQLEAAEKEIQAQLEQDASGSLKLDPKKVAEYTKLREEVAARTGQQRAEELTLEQEIKGKTLHSQRLETQEASLRAELEAGDKLIGEYADRLARLQAAISEGARDGEGMKRERDAKTSEATKSQAKIVNLTGELEEVSNKLKEAGEDRRRNKQEERMQEAVETMQRIFTGVHGKLLDLCRPIQKQYAQAVAVAAGKQMDAIVVDTKQVAAECIRYLKDQRIGTCTFLPLDNLEQKPVPDRLRTFAPKYRLCIDLMDCEDKVKPALAYALGHTLVCETLEEAQELCFAKNEKIKVVTARGHVISKNGAMTGGSAAGGGGSADRWEEKEVERLKRRKAEIETELAATKKSCPSRQELIDLETRLKTLLTRIQFSEADKKVTDEKLAQLRQQRDLKDKALRALKAETSGLKADVSKLETRRAELHRSIRDVENELFGPFSASVGVANIREYEEKQLKKHQDNVKKRTAVAEQHASLVAQLDYALKRDFSGVLKRLQAQEDEATKDLSTMEKQETSLLSKETELRTAMRALNDKVASIKQEREKANSIVKSKQTARASVVEEREGFSKKLASEEILIERARSHLHEVLQKAQVEEVALPTLEIESEDGSEAAGADDELRWGGDSQNKGGKKRQQRDRDRGSSDEGSSVTNGGSKTSGSTHFSQSENRAVQADRKKMAKVDLSSMRKLKNLSKQELAAHEAAQLKRIAALVAELETIQPNMHAVERFEGVTEKLKEVESELSDHNEKASEVAERFEEVKATRTRLFQECFEHVSNVLGVIYKDLTMSTKHPAGGNAYLTLEDSTLPFTSGTRFHAMPPMKRFRDMEQLSGGEKTMAALALLFSIHSYRQAPFFVLDEVDAALDNVNVKKICNYIKQRSRDFQCIVISLKDMFFEHADSLVGVCKDVDSLSSQLLTLDLKGFDESPMDETTGAGGDTASVASPVSTASGVRSPAGSGSAGSKKKAGGAGSAGKSEVLGKRKVQAQAKPSRRVKLQTVGEVEGEGEGEEEEEGEGEEEEKFSLAGEEDD